MSPLNALTDGQERKRLKDALVGLCSMGPGDWYVDPGHYEHCGAILPAARSFETPAMERLVALGLAERGEINETQRCRRRGCLHGVTKYRATQDGSVECGRMFMEGDFA